MAFRKVSFSLFWKSYNNNLHNDTEYPEKNILPEILEGLSQMADTRDLVQETFPGWKKRSNGNSQFFLTL